MIRVMTNIYVFFIVYKHFCIYYLILSSWKLCEIGIIVIISTL